jgi:hypothetical protein
MSTLSLLVLVVVFAPFAVFSASASPYYTIYNVNGKYSIKNVNDPSGIVTAKYENNVTESGWAYLTLKSNADNTDQDQMYAAGYLEGALTVDLIYAFYQDIYAGEYNSTQMSQAVIQWLQENRDFMDREIKSHPNDPYWVHIGLVLLQLDGLLDGYNAYASSTTQMTPLQFLLMNMDGDMADLMAAMNDSSVDWNDDMSVIRNYIYNSHCSVLVKVADDFSELYAGHTTWTGYEEMVRIYKTYNLPVSTQHSSDVTTFSGYPATLSSIDDYYLLDTGLMVTETTNGVMNNTLYEEVKPHSVLSFIRVIVANKMASNGQEWVELFSKYNSGTYNNQWIIVDTTKLLKGTGLAPGTLYILEQIPGYIASADVTEILSYGYWPSYNVPYFPYIYQVSGFQYYSTKYGPFFSYENNPRAEIFRRDSNKVLTIEDMQRALRYNDYSVDPLSQGTPAYAISSRFDLVTGNVSNPFLVNSAFGGIDSKVTSSSLAKNMTSYIQSGPSYDNNPPFQWTSAYADVVHLGQPTVWNFPWVQVQYSD